MILLGFNLLLEVEGHSSLFFPVPFQIDSTSSSLRIDSPLQNLNRFLIRYRIGSCDVGCPPEWAAHPLSYLSSSGGCSQDLNTSPRH